MKLKVQRKKLGDALDSARSVAVGKGTMPILACVKLEARKLDERIHIDVTDLTTSLSIAVDCDSIDTAGALCVDAAKFATVVKAMPGDVVDLTLKESQLVVSSKKTRIEVPTLPAIDFPAMPKLGDCAKSTVACSALLEGLRFALPAVSADESRYNITGVHIEQKDGNVFFVSTDGHRMQIREVVETLGESVDATVPTKAVGNLLRFLPATGACDVAFEKGRMFVELEGVKFSAKLLESAFPPWRVILSEADFSSTIAIPRQEAEEALKRAMLAAPESMCVDVEIAGKELRLHCESSAESTSSDEAVELESKGKMRFSLNGKYLAQALALHSTSGVDLAFSNAVGLRSLDGKAVSIIMPMRS